MRPLTTRRSPAALAPLAAALALAATVARPALAQDDAARTPAVAAGAPPATQLPARPRVTRTLSTGPLALPFGVASAEFEQAVGRRGLAVGVGAFTTFTGEPEVANDGGSQRFQSLQAKLKYYPREDGLRGFSVGVTGGVAYERELRTRFSGIDANGRETVYSETYAARTAPTIGATVDYNFLLGRQRRFLLGLGFGTRRALGGSRGDPMGEPLIDGRLQVGLGF